jgi:phosphate-selective porin
MKNLLLCSAGLVAVLASVQAPAYTVWSADDLKLDVNGNAQYDYGRIDVGSASGGAQQAGQWRRQRLGMLLERKDVADLAIEYDFYADSWTDVRLTIRGVWGGQLLLGQFKQPFGLEELVSNRRTLHQEASLASSFVIGRRLGVGYLFNPSAFGVQLGVFDRNLTGAPSSQGAAARVW